VASGGLFGAKPAEVKASTETGPKIPIDSWLKFQRPGLFGHC